jgi:hypothetical protein
MRGCETAVECNKYCSGIVSKHFYFNTVITLVFANPTFEKPIKKPQISMYEGFRSEADDKIWKVDKIRISPIVKG